MEHEEQADRMEEDADKLEQHSEQLGERIDDIGSDWERKEQDVPPCRARSPTQTEPLPTRSGRLLGDALLSEAWTRPRADQGWAAALFAVGLLLLFLNPPSLTGARGWRSSSAAALVLVLGMAWATVALAGSDSMPEHEFERLVRRSEELARQSGPDAPRPTSSTCSWPTRSTRCPRTSSGCSTPRPVVVSQLGAENRAYGHYFGDTVARDDYPDRIVSTRTRSSATSATTPICSARRWSARCATSWPITWAGTSPACATWASRLTRAAQERCPSG